MERQHFLTALQNILNSEQSHEQGQCTSKSKAYVLSNIELVLGAAPTPASAPTCYRNTVTVNYILNDVKDNLILNDDGLYVNSERVQMIVVKNNALPAFFQEITPSKLGQFKSLANYLILVDSIQFQFVDELSNHTQNQNNSDIQVQVLLNGLPDIHQVEQQFYSPAKISALLDFLHDCKMDLFDTKYVVNMQAFIAQLKQNGVKMPSLMSARFHCTNINMHE